MINYIKGLILYIAIYVLIFEIVEDSLVVMLEGVASEIWIRVWTIFFAIVIAYRLEKIISKIDELLFRTKFEINTTLTKKDLE